MGRASDASVVARLSLSLVSQASILASRSDGISSSGHDRVRRTGTTGESKRPGVLAFSVAGWRVPKPGKVFAVGGEDLNLSKEKKGRTGPAVWDAADIAARRLFLISLSASTMWSKRFSKACFRARTVQKDTHIPLPIINRIHSITCCHVVNWLKLTVLSPVFVNDETTRNRASTYGMLA